MPRSAFEPSGGIRPSWRATVMPSAKALFSTIRPSRTISTSTPSRKSFAPVASTPWNGVPVNVPRASQRTAARSSWIVFSRTLNSKSGNDPKMPPRNARTPSGAVVSTWPRTFSRPPGFHSVTAVSRSRRVSASK